MDEVEEYLRSEHPAAADLAVWTVGALRAADPDLSAQIRRGWRSVNFRHPEAGYVCGLFCDRGVRLFFERGGRLPDPQGVLEGDGLRGRWLPVAAADEATAERIRGFVHDAIVRALT